MHLLSSGTRQFQTPIARICTPFYSKQDFRSYRLERDKLFILNVLTYLCFAMVYFFLEDLYIQLGIKKESLSGIVNFSQMFILYYGTLMAVNNFLIGIFIINQFLI